jgi:sterol desaturase/sphingolipid hydroxylase (fatty acid hydroxylase superfamily)
MLTATVACADTQNGICARRYRYEFNYGTPMVPFDKLFGTYQDGSKWEKKGVKKE